MTARVSKCTRSHHHRCTTKQTQSERGKPRSCLGHSSVPLSTRQNRAKVKLGKNRWSPTWELASDRWLLIVSAHMPRRADLHAKSRFYRHVILILIVAAIVYLVGNERVGLWDRDEPRYAQTSRQMLQ